MNRNYNKFEAIKIWHSKKCYNKISTVLVLNYAINGACRRYFEKQVSIIDNLVNRLRQSIIILKIT